MPEKALVLPDEATAGELYGPFAWIESKRDALKRYNALIERNRRITGNPAKVARRIEKANIGWAMGYYDEATRTRVLNWLKG